jgi:hypothetical protein
MTSSSWWANKLNNGQQKPASTPQYVAPQPATYAQPQNPQYPPTQQLTPSAPRCPNCNSGNYGGGTPEARARCYDCGYPITQSGSGLGTGITSGPKPTGPVLPAKQVATGGWNPQTIIGKIE